MGQEVKMDEYEGGVRPPLLHRLAKPLRGPWPRQGWRVPVHCVTEGLTSSPGNASNLTSRYVRVSDYKMWPCQSWFFLFVFNQHVYCSFVVLTDERAACVTGSIQTTFWYFPSASDHCHDDWQSISIRMLAIFVLLKLSSESSPPPSFFPLELLAQPHLVLLKTLLQFLP